MYPLLITTFNRPDSFQTVLLSALRCGRVDVFVSIDGARVGNTKDLNAIEKILEIINKAISDFPKVDIRTNRFTENLGCKLAVSGALNWFFCESGNKAGIILEDDCIPNSAFFQFMDAMLERYAADRRIGMISGRNPLPENEFEIGSDYCFSSFGPVWGWATWSRIACDFDVYKIEDRLNEIEENIRKSDSFSTIEKYYRLWTIQSIKRKEVDSWAYLWNIKLDMENLLAIVPASNMIKNIGINEDATHTNSSFKDSNLLVSEKNSLSSQRSPEVQKNNLFVDSCLKKRQKFPFQFYLFSESPFAEVFWGARALIRFIGKQKFR